MSDDRLPKSILYGELATGKRHQGQSYGLQTSANLTWRISAFAATHGSQSLAIAASGVGSCRWESAFVIGSTWRHTEDTTRLATCRPLLGLQILVLHTPIAT